MARCKLYACRLFILLIAVAYTESSEADDKYDPCIVNPCKNNCSCQLVPNSEDKKYRCIGGNDSCTWNALGVHCFDDEIRVTLPSWLLHRYALKYNVTFDDITTALYISNKFNPNDAECKAVSDTTKQNNAQYSFTLPAPFISCDTVAKIVGDSPDDGMAVVTNQVWFEKTVANFYGYPIVLANVRCFYPRLAIEKSFVNPVCCKPKPFLTVNGSVNVQMDVWGFLPSENSSKDAAFDFPLSIPIGQELFVTVESARTLGYHLTLLDCYVSSQFVVGKDFYSVDIIKDKCPAKSTKFHHEILSNGSGRRSLFMFKVFELDQTADIYIHCHVKLCKKHCQCTSNRQRRSDLVSLLLTSADFHRDLTRGPIHVTKQRTVKKQAIEPGAKNEKRKETRFSWMVPTLLAISNITCVALLGALCYALGRTLSSRRNRRLRESLRGTPIGDLFARREQSSQSGSGDGVVRLLKVKPQFDFARQCSMLTKSTSPDNATQ